MVQIIRPAALGGRGRERKKILAKRKVAVTQANSSKVRGKAKPFHPTSCAPALQIDLACVADAPAVGDHHGLPRHKPTLKSESNPGQIRVKSWYDMTMFQLVSLGAAQGSVKSEKGVLKARGANNQVSSVLCYSTACSRN